MKAMRKIWAITLVAIALLCAIPAIAQVAVREVMDTRTETPVTPSRPDVTPLDSRPSAPVVMPAEAAAPVRAFFDGGGDPVPPIPGSAMDTDSRDIYIYVTLLAPDGPPPPDFTGENGIISKNCTPGTQNVEFKADLGPVGYYGDYFNVYRDTIPLFFMSQLRTAPATRNLIGMTETRFFTDDFRGSPTLPDTLWQHYPSMSKGVCDTLVNLFYVFTTVDTGSSAPDGYSESYYPSVCLAEYDQPIYAHPTYGTTNYWSIPNYDTRFDFCDDLYAIGIRQVMEWDANSQVPVAVGIYNTTLSRWLPNGALKVGHVYQVSGNYAAMVARDEDYTYFQTYLPGHVPSTDTTFVMEYSSLYGGRNIIMLPFKTSIVEGITNRASLVTSIEEAGSMDGIELYRIDKWDGAAFIWNTIALKITPTLWNANPVLKAGRVYRIWLRTSTVPEAEFTWPVL